MGHLHPREKSGMIPWELIREMVAGMCITSAARRKFKEVARRYSVRGWDCFAGRRGCEGEGVADAVVGVSGSMKSYPEFDEVTALGKAARQADKSSDAA